MKVKIIYGSDTGNTEHLIDTFLLNMLSDFELEIAQVSEITDTDWSTHECYSLGIPTWYDGELQSDWEDYFEDFKNINFEGKKVAIFGLGDQLGYDTWFCDGIGILAKVVLENGGKVIGYTTKDESYDFDTSKALLDKDTFYGLALDEDNQDNLTEQRLQDWINLIKKDII